MSYNEKNMIHLDFRTSKKKSQDISDKDLVEDINRQLESIRIKYNLQLNGHECNHLCDERSCVL